MTEPEAAGLSPNPGQILKTAREENNYPVDRVAGELHLRASVVEAMESENYDSFSSTVFLKGYFRAYCRLLNLPEDRMVERLDEQLAERQKRLDELTAHARKLKLHRARKKLALVSVLSLVIVAVAALIFDDVYPWRDADVMTSESQIGVDVNADPAEQNGDTNSETKASDVTATTVTPAQDPATAESTQNEVGVQGAEEQGAELESEQVVEHSAGQEPLQAPEEDLSTNVEDQAPLTAQPTTTSTITEVQFIASFSGDCWFSLKDGSGKTRVVDLKHTGDVVSLKGPLPFHVVLGNALLAQISLDGKSLDLKQYATKNGRAEFTLGKEFKPGNEF